jgi:PAS domain S-box-containing protein
MTKNRVATFFATHLRLAWVAALGMSVGLGALVWTVDANWRQQQRLSLLQTEAQRSSIEISSSTLNGNLMGSITLLGLIDGDIKQDATNGLLSVNSNIPAKLAAVGSSFEADGVFVVGGDGIVKTSWERANAPSTGVNVQFRPYFHMALQGKNNVYAAVSIARGDRAIYFTAPIFAEQARSTIGVGALVARTNLNRVDDLLKNRFDTALLLSPQGVVFASNHPQWVGTMAGAITPQRLQVLREVKQFGAMFDTEDPKPLPVTPVTGVQRVAGVPYAVASAPVNWNDPTGDWTLLVLEDLTQSVPWQYGVLRAAFAAVLAGLLAWMLLHLFKGRHAQAQASEKLHLLAQAQESQLHYRTQMAQAFVRLQQCDDARALCQTYLAEAHRVFGAVQGVVYARASDTAPALQLMASHACGESPPAEVALGEGLLGQCASEKTARVIGTVEEGFWTIHSGLGHTRPQALVIAPILQHTSVLGAVEIAILDDPERFPHEHFAEFTQLLAMNLQILARAQHTRQILADTAAARQASAELLAFQQTLIDTIPYPLFYKGADARFIGFNRAYEEAFGVQRETLIGKTVLELEYLPLADRQAYQAEDEATIAAGSAVRRTMQIPLSDGRLHHTLYYVAGFRAPDGRPGGLVGTVVDLDTLGQEGNTP